jgi:hypothetical protein
MISGRLIVLWALTSAFDVSGQEIVLESKRLHLGKTGQFEWDVFKDQKVDVFSLRRTFQSKRCASGSAM